MEDGDSTDTDHFLEGGGVVSDDPLNINSHDDEDESLTSLLETASGSEVFPKSYDPPNVRWLWVFPRHLEKKLQWFDDPIVQWCQKLSGKFWKTFSLAVTAVVAIEIGIAVPYLLFFLGYDGIATELAYLAIILAIISQIPKRFVWRLRPYMAGRAKLVKKDMTSSFPSRAVTCATVYAFGVIWTYMYIYTNDDDKLIFRWWMPVLFVSAVLLSSFARMNLGVHYASDCVAGMVQGLCVALVGTVLWRTDILGCESCHSNHCYSPDSASSITIHSSVMRINWWVVVVVVVVIIGVPILSVAKPIDFWSKCDRVYAMLLPAIAFQLILLCPHSTREHYSLPPPHAPHWYSFVLALALVAGATVIGAKFGGKRPLLMYILEFLTLSAALFFWRLLGM